MTPSPPVPATADPTTPVASSRQGCDWEAARSDAEMILALLAAKHIGPEEIEAIRDIQNRMDNLARCFQALAEALAALEKRFDAEQRRRVALSDANEVLSEQLTALTGRK